MAAGVLFELSLRPFVAGGNQPGGTIRTIRSYYEGFAVAHFEADGMGTFGNRLTGNPALAGAPEGLILGDSHVIAQAVRDGETMGAVIERLSRGAGHPLNVRQYGWSSANSPTYLAVAEALLRERNPAWVVVVLNAANISVRALTTTQNWRMEVLADDSVRLIDMRPGPGTAVHEMRRVIGRSALALALRRRVGVIENRAGNADSLDENAPLEQSNPRLAEEAARVPRATVLGLQRAYGSRLIIVYTPYFPGTQYDTVEPLEQELLGLCEENEVACVSMREALVRDRYRNSRLSRGFHNTAPGEGHFNAIGHQIIGEEIWRYISSRSSPPA